MEIEEFIIKIKYIHEAILDLINTTSQYDEEFYNLIHIFDYNKILENKDDIQMIFQIISKITDNHHRSSDFIPKLDKIFEYIIKAKPAPMSDYIIDPIHYNSRILLHLLEKQYIKPDKSFIDYYLSNIDEFHNYFYYLYPGMKFFINEEKQKQIENEIKNKYGEVFSTFAEKCHIGENDSYICSLIRQDSIIEFISHVNRNNIPLNGLIEPSIYESNSFLKKKIQTISQYASFYGSMQIIQHLKYNGVPLNPSLWLYAIHSQNPELIHFFEANIIELNKISYDYIFKESIKCHHNDISNYARDNLLIKTDDIDEINNDFVNCIFKSLDFNLFPDDITFMISNPGINHFHLSQLCFKLTTITIPSSISSIGNDAFSGCSSIETIIIPPSIISIGKGAFKNCFSLKQIIFENTSKLNYIGDYAFAKCSSLTDIIIPSFVKSIKNNTFSGCSSLAQITIPSSVKSIEKYAFAKCKSLKQILFEQPSSLQSIGSYAFSKCSSLMIMTIPYFVRSIENYAFAHCSSLTQIFFEYPSSTKYIKNRIFKGCPSIIQITIPSSISSIGQYAFFGCSKLTQL